MSARVAESDVTIKLKHGIDEDGEYNAFTYITVDILVCGSTQAGTIDGTIVNRQKIPNNGFLSAMDGHSGDLQYIGVSLFDAKRGRTILNSLREGGDDDEFDFMYISSICLEEQYKTSSDVGAFALRKLLHHPYVKGQCGFGCWRVSSCVYILDPYEAMSKEEKIRIKNEEQAESLRDSRVSMGGSRQPETEESMRAKEQNEQRLEKYARVDANQFLRNGFFQDPAVARNGGNAVRFLVASYSHWTKPLTSQADAAAVKFYAVPPAQRPPTGQDALILDVTIRMCGGEPSNSNTSPDVRAAYRMEVSRLEAEGGSLLQSNALHAAVANNSVTIVKCIIDMDPSTVNSKDRAGCTPLMIAAARAAGMSSKSGIPREQPIIDLLLTTGADKDTVDHRGMTAYGNLKQQLKEYAQMMSAMMGMATGSGAVVPGLSYLEAKLMPSGGPTVGDVSGGTSGEAGIIDYKDEDGEDHYEDDDDDY